MSYSARVNLHGYCSLSKIIHEFRWFHKDWCSVFFASKCVKMVQMCILHIYTQLYKSWCKCSKLVYIAFVVVLTSGGESSKLKIVVYIWFFFFLKVVVHNYISCILLISPVKSLVSSVRQRASDKDNCVSDSVTCSQTDDVE